MDKSNACTHKNTERWTMGGVTFTVFISCKDCGKTVYRSDRDEKTEKYN